MAFEMYLAPEHNFQPEYKLVTLVFSLFLYGLGFWALFLAAS